MTTRKIEPSRSPRRRRRLPLASWTTALLIAAGCGSDGEKNGMNSEVAPDTGTDTDTDTDGGASTACQDGWYALATSVPSGQDSTSMFVATHCGLGAGELSLDEAIEVPGGGRIFTYPEESALFIHSFEQETLTRVDVLEEGTMQVGGSLSLARYGGSFANLNHFVSPTKAMFFDGGSSSVILWNPSAMEITGDVPLPFSPDDGAHPGFEGAIPSGRADYAVALDDGRLLVPLWWVNWESVRMWPGFSALLVDPSADTVELVESADHGCPAALHLTRDPNGDLLIAADAWSLAFAWSGQDDLPHTCTLRTTTGSTEFADVPVVDLRPRIGGRSGGGLSVSASGTAYTTAYYAEIGDSEPDIFARFNAGAAWKIWRFAFEGNGPGEEIAGIPAGAGNVPFYQFGDRLYVNVDLDDTAQVFFEIPDDGAAIEGLSVPGDWLIAVGLVRP